MNGHFIVFVLSRNIWRTFFTAEPLVTWHTVLILLLPTLWDGPLFFCFLALASTPEMWKQGGFLPWSWVFPGDFIHTHSFKKIPFLQWLCIPAVSLQTHSGHHVSASDLLSRPSRPRGLSCLVSESTTEWKLVQALHAASNSDNVYHIPFFTCGHLTLKTALCTHSSDIRSQKILVQK